MQRKFYTMVIILRIEGKKIFLNTDQSTKLMNKVRWYNLMKQNKHEPF